MESQSASIADSSSHDSYSAPVCDVPIGDAVHDNPGSSLPELDNDVSTEDFTSDYPSTRTTSLLGPALGPDDNYETIPYDIPPLYSPSHYPSVPVPYRTERPYDDEEEETINSTRSVTDLDLDYVQEHGRRYCGSYYMPNDDDEQVRLQLINQVYLKVFEGELTSVPLECPTHILDIGTAVGEWAIDIAEAYPECEVTGTDISNIFERQAPPNVFWEVDDAELEWERPTDSYDLVHLRNLAGSFSDWQSIYRSAFKCLKPGGWLEVLDFDDHKGMRAFYSFFEPGSLIHRVAQDTEEASMLSGRPRGVGHLEPRFLVNAGYVDVKLTEHAIPLRTEDGSTGKFWLLAMLNGIEATCLRLLTKFKGWEAKDVRLAADMIGEEMMAMALNPRRAKGCVLKVRVMTGRKPGHLRRWSPASISESGEVMKRRIPEESTEDIGVEEESGYVSDVAHAAEGSQTRSRHENCPSVVDSEDALDDAASHEAFEEVGDKMEISAGPHPGDGYQSMEIDTPGMINRELENAGESSSSKQPDTGLPHSITTGATNAPLPGRAPTLSR
ncbi:S-adenosyl-L-methionine-dependent methyltransferase [Xylariaceae sp. FL0804]|nr:S-adenosyl-L-methionine-dependent methyltransferase [Xylariaceae sp. FL0804]